MEAGRMQRPQAFQEFPGVSKTKWRRYPPTKTPPRSGRERSDSPISLLRRTFHRASRFNSSGALHFCQQLHELLFALRLIVAAFGVRHLRDVHRAELWPAHRAELRFLVKIVGKVFVVHRFRSRGIERKLELFVPVKEKPRIAQRIVAVTRARPVP